MFEKVKLVRGFTEIEQLFYVAKTFGLTICGGYARYAASPRLNPVPASDVDLFPIEKENFEKAEKYFDSEGLEVEYENDVSLTYKRPHDVNHKWRTTPTIQLIKPSDEARLKTYGQPVEILQNFDFTIVRACILSPTEVLVDNDFMEDELHTRLSIRNIHCPVSSMFRAIKYMKRGYFLQPIESLKLFIDWQERGAEYQNKVIGYLEKIKQHQETGENTLSEKELWEFERLMKID